MILCGKSRKRVESQASIFGRKRRNPGQSTEIAIPTLEDCIGIVGGRPIKIHLKDLPKDIKKGPQPIEVDIKCYRKTEKSIHLHLLLFIVMCTKK